MIGNGISYQKIYICDKQWKSLEKYYTKKYSDEIRNNFKNIVSTYE